MESKARNAYLITKEMKNFLIASVLTMAIGQLTTTIDGIIVSHLVSPDALSAITLFLPVNLVISAIITLLGLGACIIATKAMGRRDKDAVSGILSTALISVIVAGLCFAFVGFVMGDKIAWLLTQDRETNRKLLFDTDNQLIGWMNKAEQQFKWVNEPLDISTSSMSEQAFSGLHFFRSDLFAEFEVKRSSVIDLYLALAKTNRILSKPIQPDYWFDLGKPEQLLAAEGYLNNIAE